MLGFVKTMVNGMDISPTGTKVGVITYSDRTHLEFHLNAHNDKQSLDQAISGIRYISGGTNTADALKYARETSFQTVNGARGNAAKIAIVITDGKSTSSIATSAEAQRLRQQGVTVFSVGVGAANKQELDAMATDPDNSHVFVVNNFDALKQINGELAQKACEGIKHRQELKKKWCFCSWNKFYKTCLSWYNNTCYIFIISIWSVKATTAPPPSNRTGTYHSMNCLRAVKMKTLKKNPICLQITCIDTV